MCVEIFSRKTGQLTVATDRFDDDHVQSHAVRATVDGDGERRDQQDPGLQHGRQERRGYHGAGRGLKVAGRRPVSGARAGQRGGGHTGRGVRPETEGPLVAGGYVELTPEAERRKVRGNRELSAVGQLLPGLRLPATHDGRRLSGPDGGRRLSGPDGRRLSGPDGRKLSGPDGTIPANSSSYVPATTATAAATTA